MKITNEKLLALDGCRFPEGAGWLAVDLIRRDGEGFTGLFAVTEGVDGSEKALWEFYRNADGSVEFNGGGDGNSYGEEVLRKLENAIIESEYVEAYPSAGYYDKDSLCRL